MATPQADFNDLVRATRKDILSLVQDFANSELSASEFETLFRHLLLEAHQEAAAMGRGLALNQSVLPGFADLNLANNVMKGESEFIDALIYDLQSGRYVDDGGTLNLVAVKRRALSYTGRLRGTANEAFVYGSSDQARFEWRMRALEHCEDCPAIAELSPYYSYELPTFPGANVTECLFNCKCVLVREDGVTCFEPAQ